MRKLFLVSAFFIFFFNSCSVVEFSRYYAEADSSNGRLNGMVYESEDTAYVIGKLPDTWKIIEIEGGDLAFVNEGSDATITVNSTCDLNKLKYSLEALSNSLVIGIDNKQLVVSQESMINDVKALKRVYSGRLSGAAINLSTVVLKKGNCIYDFSYASSPDNFETGFNDFNGFISDFKTLSLVK